MYRNIFIKTLRDGRRSTLLVGIGLFLIGIYVAVLFPDVGESFSDLMDNMPEFLQSIIGDAAEFATPEGFFSTQPFGVLGPIIMMSLAINRGIAAVSGEEEGNTLDQLMANPVSRTSLILQKSLSLLISVTVPTVFLGASLLLGASIMNFEFSFSKMLQMLISLLLLAWAMGFLALAVGAATGSKSMALGVSATVAAASYLIHLLAPMVDAISFTKYFSVMYYYIGDRPFVNGMTLWHGAVLAIIALLSLVCSVYAFNRRDLH